MTLLRSWRTRAALVLAVVGPGFITANVDNDAGGIATYSVAGAQFGYTLLWTMIPITIALVVVQEMSSRMGAVTGKGLSDLIREEFGLRATFLLMLALVLTNFGNVVSEFAGIASSFELFGVWKYNIETGAEAAQALRPLAGEYAYLLFAAGLFNASIFAASILPISTAYAVCEGLGLESGLDKRFEEAPAFYWLYTALVVFGAGVVLFPHFPLFRVMVFSQLLNGVLLPFVLIFVLLLVNDKELMGEYMNSRWYNVASWLTVGVMIALTIAMVIAQLRG